MIGLLEYPSPHPHICTVVVALALVSTPLPAEARTQGPKLSACAPVVGTFLLERYTRGDGGQVLFIGSAQSGVNAY